MKKVYKFNLIPGVEFVEKDEFYYAASYEKNNRTLYRELTFAKKTIGDRDKTIKEKDKEIEYLCGKLREEIMKSEAYIDRINTLETTLKKKDETIEKLRNTAEFANDICDGYGALTDMLISSIKAKNSEIKVLSDQVTRLMDQLKEVMEGNSGCKSCLNGPEPCCDICGNTDCEHRVKKCREGIVKEAKSETNFGKALRNKCISALDAWLEENIKED